MNQLLAKHQFSSASDALVDYIIDRDKRLVSVKMRTYHGTEFFSATALRMTAEHLLERHDIEIRDTDGEGLMDPPRRSIWTAHIWLVGACYLARITRQIHINSVAIELHPIK